MSDYIGEWLSYRSTLYRRISSNHLTQEKLTHLYQVAKEKLKRKLHHLLDQATDVNQSLQTYVDDFRMAQHQFGIVVNMVKNEYEKLVAGIAEKGQLEVELKDPKSGIQNHKELVKSSSGHPYTSEENVGEQALDPSYWYVYLHFSPTPVVLY